MKIRELLILSFLIIFGAFNIGDAQQNIAPNFALYTAGGERFVFYSLLDALPEKGLAVINFTSVDCRPCRKEIPELKEMADKGGTQVKLLCIYAEAGDKVKVHATGLGVLENAYVDALGSIRGQFNVQKFPVTIIVDKNRCIRGRFEGYTKGNIASLRNLLE